MEGGVSPTRVQVCIRSLSILREYPSRHCIEHKNVENQILGAFLSNDLGSNPS